MAIAMYKAAILNDTRGHHHFGCHRVVGVIEKMLAARGFAINARSLVRQRWWEDGEFLNAVLESDLIVINGEGTLHHGIVHGENLLKIARHPVRIGKPIALVNALYQENPSEWKQFIDRIDYLNVRDSRSAFELRRVAQRDVDFCLDFCLYEDEKEGAAPVAKRNRLMVGDSVRSEINSDLMALARRDPDSIYLPIVKTLKSSRPQYGPVGYKIREFFIRAHTELFKLSMPNAMFCEDEADYCNELRSASFHLTGRFHGVCMSLLARAPFITYHSNSWKIEALLEDVGFGRSRLIGSQDTFTSVKNRNFWEFEDMEMERMDGLGRRVRNEVEEVMDRVVQLAR